MTKKAKRDMMASLARIERLLLPDGRPRSRPALLHPGSPTTPKELIGVSGSETLRGDGFAFALIGRRPRGPLTGQQPVDC
jgi:hypothetical protein